MKISLRAALPVCLVGLIPACTQPQSDDKPSAERPSGYKLEISTTTQVDASFRGLSCAADGTFWASGSDNNIWRSLDQGQSWQSIPAPEAGPFDFRDNHGFDQNAAIVMAAGPGDASAVYETVDGGKNWSLALANPDEEGFFDSISVDADGSGVLLGDPVDGRFSLFHRNKNGEWQRVSANWTPNAEAEEHCFAASGTIVTYSRKHGVQIVTGGKVSRLLHHDGDIGLFRYTDMYGNWWQTALPIRFGEASQGAFSIAYRNPQMGIIVGGDYSDPQNSQGIAARTVDGGKSWHKLENGPSGYRSCVTPVPGTKPPVWVAVGSHGADWSQDDGLSWQPIPDLVGYHAVIFDQHGNGVAVGSPEQPFARIQCLPW